MARDSKSPAERRPDEPRISAEPGRHQIDDEQEADDDAVPHQMHEEAGLGLCAFARPLVSLAVGVVLELWRRRHILRRIESDTAVFLRLVIESRAHLTLEPRGLRLEIGGSFGVE